MPEQPVPYGVFTICGVFTIQPGHPCLPGHFPGNPIVPGVVLLDHTLALVRAACPGRDVSHLRNVRFRRPVRPGQAVAVQIATGRKGDVDFTGLHAGEIMLSGSARLEAAQPL